MLSLSNYLIADELSLDSIKRELSISNSAVFSGMGSIEYNYEVINPVEKEALFNAKQIPNSRYISHIYSKIEFIFNYNKIYCHCIATDNVVSNLITTYAYNGINTDKYVLNPNSSGILRPYGEILIGNKIPNEYNPLFIRDTVDSILSESEDIEYTGEESVDGISCQVLQYGLNSILWLADEFQFNPIKVINYYEDTRIVYDIQYDNHDSFYFPKMITTQYFVDDELYWTKSLKMSVDWKINTPVEDSQFDIDFPEGLTINDQTN